MIDKLTIEELNLEGKTVLMRVDFNVPLDQEGNITDDTRIQAVLPSINYILNHGGALVLMSHLGRPKGVPSKKLSLEPCAKCLFEILNRPVSLAPDCVGEDVSRLAKNLKPGEILLLENLRFHNAEMQPKEDPSFSQKLAELGDLYVNDAFGTAHRNHASVTEVPKYFPEKSAMGFLLREELEYLDKLVHDPGRPFYAILGGAKISTKLGVIKSLLKKVDGLLIGGGMAYTFLRAQGIKIGDSICEEDLFDYARGILDESVRSHVKIYLPEDIVISNRLNDHPPVQVIDALQGIPLEFEGLDIGPKTVKHFLDILQDAQTIFWNGPLGVFEIPEFAHGTNEIARGLANLPATTIVGGGDSIAAMKKAGLAHQVTHLSTGGGASLEYIEHNSLPGIEALSSKVIDKKSF